MKFDTWLLKDFLKYHGRMTFKESVRPNKKTQHICDIHSFSWDPKVLQKPSAVGSTCFSAQLELFLY